MNATTLMEQRSVQTASKAQGNEDTQARIGAIARELHDALRSLGAAPELQRIIREIPDARSRLSYVGDMTEKAAHRVLSLVDQAMPVVMAHREQAGGVLEMIAGASPSQPETAEGASRPLDTCGALAQRSVAFAVEQQEILSQIMLTQDFQDLSGQVIKKVIDMITRTESQLVQLLIDGNSGHPAPQAADAELQGPQTPELALAQDDVDDLLASMGF